MIAPLWPPDMPFTVADLAVRVVLAVLVGGGAVLLIQKFARPIT